MKTEDIVYWQNIYEANSLKEAARRAERDRDKANYLKVSMVSTGLSGHPARMLRMLDRQRLSWEVDIERVAAI
jgi:hypothetical protein